MSTFFEQVITEGVEYLFTNSEGAAQDTLILEKCLVCLVIVFISVVLLHLWNKHKEKKKEKDLDSPKKEQVSRSFINITIGDIYIENNFKDTKFKSRGTQGENKNDKKKR